MPNHNKVPDPEQLEKERKVLELRRAGFTWQQIADQVGYADHTGAYAAYKRVSKRFLEQSFWELTNQELDRIDRLQLAAWTKAMKGDVASIAVIIRLMERRARLLGLDKPVKIEQEITTWEGGDSIDRAVRDLANLLRANAETSPSEGTLAGDTGTTKSITAKELMENMANSDGSGLGQN